MTRRNWFSSVCPSALTCTPAALGRRSRPDIDHLIAQRRNIRHQRPDAEGVGLGVLERALGRENLARRVDNFNCGSRRRQLHRELDHVGALPGQRIEHQHPHALAAALRIDVAGDGCGSLAGGRVRGKADHVVVLLRVLINDADARSRGQIVELVEEHFLPGLVELRRPGKGFR